MWACEFCGTRNTVEIDDEEVPSKESMDYIVEPAPPRKGGSDAYTVFVCDVSGSMCVTQRVEGQFELKVVRTLSHTKKTRLKNTLDKQLLLRPTQSHHTPKSHTPKP